MSENYEPNDESAAVPEAAAAENKIDVLTWVSRITDALNRSGLGAATDVAVTITSARVTATPVKEASKALQHAGDALSDSAPIIRAGLQIVNDQPALQYVVRIPGTGNVLGRLGAASKTMGPLAEAVGIIHALAEQLAADADIDGLSGTHRLGRALARAGIQSTAATVGGRLGVAAAVALVTAGTPVGPFVTFAALLIGSVAGGTGGSKAGKWVADWVLN